MTSGVVSVEEFLKMPCPAFDVRSPSEFDKGRIPNAISLPLLDDDERAAVGTAYKQAGRNEAIELGLKFVGPKLSTFISKVTSPNAKLYCWRGGLRSNSMSWLLNLFNIKSVTLNGGYKAFRRWVLSQTEIPRKIALVGGMTGSRKTSILKALKLRGEQVLDLEALACHRGSSYGMLNMPQQPSTEHFENEISTQLCAFDPERTIWIEDESRQIGSCVIPPGLFHQMRLANLFIIERPCQERIDNLLQDYGAADVDSLITATQRISKRLGGLKTRQVIEAIHQGQLQDAIEMVLKYYDSAYMYTILKRAQPMTRLSGEKIPVDQWATELINMEKVVCREKSPQLSTICSSF